MHFDLYMHVLKKNYLLFHFQWESFRSLLGRKKSEGIPKPSKKDAAGVPYKEKGGVLVEKRPPSRAEEGSTLSLSRRTDITQLMDYAPHRLAEQLTLMEQASQ